MKRSIMSSAAAAGLVAIIASDEVSAAGFMIRETSAETLATVSAGNASRAESAATVFHNPAGMTHLRGTTIEGGAAVVNLSMEFEGSASVLGTPIPGNNGGNAGSASIIPHFYGVTDIMPNLKAGIAITAPFGSTAHYDSDWYGRYLENKTVAMSIDINPGLAYRVSDQFSIGAGISAQYFRLDAAAAFPQFLIFPGTPDGIYNFKADGWAWGFNVGALIEIMPGTRIGASYRSELDYTIEGALDFANMNPLLGTVSGAAEADLTLPASANFSFTHAVNPNFSVSADVQWTGWSVFDTLLIKSGNPDFPNVQNYEDSWMISVGGVYRLNDRWMVRGGLGWDQTPVTDEFRTVAVPDADRYMLGVGFGYRINDRLMLDGGYAHYFAAEKPSMNQSANNTDPFTQMVVLNGRYTNMLDYVALTLRFTP